MGSTPGAARGHPRRGGGLLVQLENRGGIAMAGYLAAALRPVVVQCHKVVKRAIGILEEKDG